MSKVQVIKVMLGEIHPNEKNPRKITPENLKHLIRSILELPKMLELRPIITTKGRIILGGNMRFKALTEIAALDEEALRTEITSIESVSKKTDEERELLVDFWLEWQGNPYAYIKEAEMTDGEKLEFTLKDNIHAGQWDYDALREFSKEDLNECCIAPWEDSFNLEEDAPAAADQPGEDELKRIIIAFPRGRRQELEDILGIDKPGRRTYNINELNCKSHEDSI